MADIHAALQREGFDVSESYLFRVLRRAGLAATRQGRPLRQLGDYANDGSLVPSLLGGLGMLTLELWDE